MAGKGRRGDDQLAEGWAAGARMWVGERGEGAGSGVAQERLDWDERVTMRKHLVSQHTPVRSCETFYHDLLQRYTSFPHCACLATTQAEHQRSVVANALSWLEVMGCCIYTSVTQATLCLLVLSLRGGYFWSQ
eukprot:5153842-Pleurochrysis_carterae.AAC.2